MKYQGKKAAVLGAGLSGTAAALLLRSEGAEVTVLDTADEKTLLKTTVENLRARGAEVRCGPAAEKDSSSYDLVVLSPGIDPISPLATNFSSRNIETIGELELGWRSVDIPVIAISAASMTGSHEPLRVEAMLSKPFDPDALTWLAMRMLGRKEKEKSEAG